MLWLKMGFLRCAAGLVVAFWFCGFYAADVSMQALFAPLHMSITHANRALQKASTHSKAPCDPITVLKHYEQFFETDVDEILRRFADKQNDKLQSLIHSEQVDDGVRSADNRMFLFCVECHKIQQSLAERVNQAERTLSRGQPGDDICPEGTRLCRSFWELRGSVAQFSTYIGLNDYRMMHMVLCFWRDIVAMRAFNAHFGVSSIARNAQPCLPNDVLGCISTYLLPGSILSSPGLSALWDELKKCTLETPSLLETYQKHYGKAANRSIVALFCALGFANNQTVS